MTILRDAVITPLTQAQERTEAILDNGLDFPVQSCVAFDGQFNLPVWTNGDGDYYAIERGGRCVELEPRSAEGSAVL